MTVGIPSHKYPLTQSSYPCSGNSHIHSRSITISSCKALMKLENVAAPHDRVIEDSTSLQIVAGK